MSVLEAYRHRVNRKNKENVLHEIKLKSGNGGEDAGRETQKRLKNMYLVNKVKFFSKATEEETQTVMEMTSIDEFKHRILQHRIR